MEHVYLAMFLDALEHDLFKFLIAFLQKPRIENCFFDMRMCGKFVADLFVHRSAF